MPATKTAPVSDTVPILRGGKWIDPRTEQYGEVFNPSTGRVIARVPFCSAEETAAVVEAAAAALPAWSETPVVERARVMFRFRALMEQHFEELAALVTREHGKTLAEARAEVQPRHRSGRVRLRHSQPDHRAKRCRTSRPTSTPKRSAIRSASASASRRTTFRRWCRCGCFRWRSPAATRSC